MATQNAEQTKKRRVKDTNTQERRRRPTKTRRQGTKRVGAGQPRSHTQRSAAQRSAAQRGSRAPLAVLLLTVVAIAVVAFFVAPKLQREPQNQNAQSEETTKPTSDDSTKKGSKDTKAQKQEKSGDNTSSSPSPTAQDDAAQESATTAYEDDQGQTSSPEQHAGPVPAQTATLGTNSNNLATGYEGDQGLGYTEPVGSGDASPNYEGEDGVDNIALDNGDSSSIPSETDDGDVATTSTTPTTNDTPNEDESNTDDDPSASDAPMTSEQPTADKPDEEKPWIEGLACASCVAESGTTTASEIPFDDSQPQVALESSSSSFTHFGKYVEVRYGDIVVKAQVVDHGAYHGGVNGILINPGVFTKFGFGSVDAWGRRSVSYRFI